MSQDKELEIQLQFLDEAQEYLDTVEAALLGLANSGVDSQKINAALRAAHSVKGGAAMMGFQALSQLSHRLEDSFKVLKVQKNTIAIDTDLEWLLLSGLDCLRRVTEDCRQRRSIDAAWLNDHAQPIFDQLRDRLGEPQAEDATSVLSPEEGQDVVRLIFETEVDGCLQRLETAIQTQDPCLREEVEILAQELEGLGEMLQLPAFTQLCQSIAQHLTSTDRVVVVAQAALEAWRRSQACVLTGNHSALPDRIQVEGVVISDAASPEIAAFDWGTESISEAIEPAVDPFFHSTDFEQSEFASAEFDDFNDTDRSPVEPLVDSDEFDVPAALASTELTNFELTGSELTKADQLDSEQVDAATPHSPTFHQESLDSFTNPFSLSELDSSSVNTDYEAQIVKSDRSDAQTFHSPKDTYKAEFQISSDTASASFTEEIQDNTVRVPVKHLNHLNDLLGELTIERNRLDLHLKRLRSLIRTMTLRVQVLDQSNSQLRNAYDRVTTKSLTTSPLLLASANVEVPLESISTTNSENHLHNQFDERFDALEMDRYNELHLLSQEVMETIVQIQEVTSDIELGLDDTEQINRDLHKTTKQLQIGLSQVRMRPLSDVVDRFPKAIRELSLQYNKPVQLKVHGSNTLVDRNILEALSDPLLHLIRNAFDHGIEDSETRRSHGKPEQGLIEIQAFHRGNRTIITVRDDGRGISLEKIRSRAQQMGLDEMLLAAATDEELLSLIFEPGFSTTDRVTDLSGRGIGMDVVRNNLKQVRGEIRVSTEAGLGTTFTLSVPFTLSIARVLLAEAGGMLIAFPTDVIEEVTILEPEQVTNTAGSEALRWHDQLLQLIRLSRWLKFNCPRQMDGLETPPTINEPAVLILNQADQRMGMQIDRCWGEQEVALRKVEGNLPLPPGFNSCTILGDGRVVPLVSISEMLHWIASCDRAEFLTGDQAIAPSLPESGGGRLPAPTIIPTRKPTILVVDDSINVRRLLALTLEKAGYQVAQAKDGQDAIDKLTAGLQVQAVICDIEMPRLDGYGFLAKVKSTPTLEQLPVAMLTSRSGDKHRQLAMNLGATAYFSKPYNEQVLLQTLSRLIDLAPAS
ncbi:hybrid sensor histidine kinase/response regulator [Thermocoleostomius sinensis]|uniref:histidine kinase n=1 Tax=Thermocoleostomius sinensis A174 TaxID=2016057 RepID=A0A9E8ZC70_9CYAN|nr:response regulator [Thermocoleostomius sinensis]WAL60463.1 response regulator [Thermocoleostomius sinensis A174]